MTKTGELSNRDKDTLLRASRIADAWVRLQTEKGNTPKRNLIVKEVEDASLALFQLACDM